MENDYYDYFGHEEIENNPEFLSPKTTAQLLSAARREFINRKVYDGPQMLAVTRLFDTIAQEVYGTRFQWSQYNRSLWQSFVACSVAREHGGTMAFSAEPEGDYKESYTPFKGIFVGGPLGYFPYTIYVTRQEHDAAVDRAIEKAGYTRSE